MIMVSIPDSNSEERRLRRLTEVLSGFPPTLHADAVFVP